MTSPVKRQPLPAVASLVALCLLTALVWWRVLSRDDGSDKSASDCPTTSAPAAVTLPEPQAVSLSAVLNSTNRTGLAGKVNTQLAKFGFRTPANAGNDPAKKKVTGVAEIRYTSDRSTEARLLAYYVPGATMVPLPADGTDEGGELDLALGAKYAKLATQSQVDAALRKDGVTLAKTISSDSSTDDCADPTPTSTGTPAS